MDDGARRVELAKFLRTRRALISPDSVGFAKGGRRRTPGLRREEIAALAHIGHTWYTWLEQGRDIQVSREAMDRIAGAMSLSASDRVYLLTLASQHDLAAEQTHDEPMHEVQELLDGFTTGPAMLWNARFDCIAFNRLADLVYEWSDASPPFGRNMTWRTFMDPKRQQMYSKAESLIHNGIGMLRVRYGSHLGHPDFDALVNALLEGSDLFRRLWNEQHTASLAPVIFLLTHPYYGELCVRSIRASFPSIPESTLVFVAPADDQTKTLFRNLAAK